ncbi:MAG: class I SAM-dependent methyltransferase [Cytophagales bacterium]
MSQINFITTNDLALKVKNLLKTYKEAHSIKKVLDIPAGEGALSQFMKEELNWDVSASDIDSSKWKYDDLNLVEADMGRKIPFEDNSFDLVVCLEGIKHVTDIATSVNHLSRVLKSQGLLLITIPNDLALEVRLRYFFDGFVDVDWHNPMSHESEESKSFLYANSMIQLPHLNYFFEKNGLKIVATDTSRFRVKSVLLAILFYPIIFFKTSKACGNKVFLRKLMCSFTWLAGRHNIIICQKIG